MELFKSIEFAAPGFFWLMLLIPVMIGWYIWKQKLRYGHLNVSVIKGFKSPVKSVIPKLRHLELIFRSLALIALIIALARPQTSLSWQNTTTEGIDIVIASDISGSMLAEDFKPNRLEAGKNIAIDFIKNRPSDRIGLVIFSGESFTQCPLTIDHSVLVNLFADVKNGMINDGTAIGMGLATAVNRLKDSEAKSKVVILLTDGSNNAGSIPPITAAEIAKQFNVRVYTVGLGTKGFAPYPVQTPMGIQYQRAPVDIDEPTLTKIARITGGKYFRATNNDALKNIYEQIDKMEKAKIDVTQYNKKTELFLPFALIGLLFLVLEFVFKKHVVERSAKLMLRFAHVEYLWGLAAIPFFLFLFLWVNNWKRKALKRLGDKAVVNKIVPHVSFFAPKLKFALFMVAFAFLVVGTADPQIGSKMVEEKRKGADLMILLDVSNSMLAQDMLPNRLENAKRAIAQLIDNLHSDRIGMVVFAGEAYVQLPVTTDYAAAKLFLNTINTEMVPTQGTAIGAAIDLGMKSFDFKNSTGKAMIIITDGENHEDDAIAAVNRAVDQNVSVNVIGMGSVEGAAIPVYRDNKQVGFRTDSAGQSVITKLNEEMCKEIAADGKGTYVRATNANSGLNIVMSQIEKVQRKTYDAKSFKDFEDRFQFFIALALLCMVVEFFISNRKSARLSKLKLFEVKNG